MNIPAIALQTFLDQKSDDEMLKISRAVADHLSKIDSSIERARFLHYVIDQYNAEVYTNPLVQKLVACKKSCSACCHTQVSVTADEADLLRHRIEMDHLSVDLNKLKQQANALNDESEYYKLSYSDRRCVFLDSENNCSVYSDRPSVCRTNAVLGDSFQCSTKLGPIEKPLVLLKTTKADMAIAAGFMVSKLNGTLPNMLYQLLKVIKINKTPRSVIARESEL